MLEDTTDALREEPEDGVTDTIFFGARRKAQPSAAQAVPCSSGPTSDASWAVRSSAWR